MWNLLFLRCVRNNDGMMSTRVQNAGILSRLPWLLLAAMLLVATGCQYKLGGGSPQTIRSIAIKPVLNDTSVPQFEPLLDAQIRERLIDGGLSIVPEAAADAVLQVRAVEYGRDLSSVRSDDSGLALSYGLQMRVEVTLIAADGKLLLDRVPVEIHREAYIESGVQVAEYQTLPVIARDLAERIKRRVLDTW